MQVDKQSFGEGEGEGKKRFFSGGRGWGRPRRENLYVM